MLRRLLGELYVKKGIKYLNRYQDTTGYRDISVCKLNINQISVQKLL